MDPISIPDLVRTVRGRWLGQDPPPPDPVQSVSTDSRSLTPGSLFVPLQGKNFDGRRFVAEAIGRGAQAALVEPGVPSGAPRGAPLIEVPNALDALERLAAHARDRSGADRLAVTGTVGKTTTKDFLGVLLATRFPTVRAPRSFNNRLGVVLTLLAADRSTRFIVSEVGTSAPGELAHLSRLVKPSRIIITEIGQAHLNGLGDLSGVIRAKAEVFEGMRPGGTGFIPEAVPGRDVLEAACRAAGGRVINFGWDRGDYRVTDWRRLAREDVHLPAGEAPVGFRFRIRDPHGFEEELILAVPGRHNVLNAVAAIAAAREAGLDWAAIRAGVRELSLPPRRLEISRHSGVTLVDDTYNASHRSALAALEEAGEIPLGGPAGRRFLILGDLLELGGMSVDIHQEIGRHAALSGKFAGLITVGRESQQAAEAAEDIVRARRATGGWPFSVGRLSRVEEVASHLAELLVPSDLVLFKASRAVGLDRAVEETRRLLLARSARSADAVSNPPAPSPPGPPEGAVVFSPSEGAVDSVRGAREEGRAACSTISMN